MKKSLLAAPFAAAMAAAGGAHAEQAPQLRAVLESALASGNDADIDTVAKYLKQASPEDAAAIDQAIADHRARTAAARQEKLAHLGVLEGWKGEGQIGASKTSGNSDTIDLSAGLSLTREGLRWRHELTALVDYQRSNGVTSGNQIVLVYEPDYKFNDRLFAFGLARYERNRFAGYTNRTTLGGGLGYRAVANSSLTVDLKAGPTWRQTDYVGAPSVSSIAAYAALKAGWKFSAIASLTQNASVHYVDDNTTVTSLTALTAKLNGSLSARAGYQVTFNSNPQPGFGKTDTLSRFTLVYGF